MVDINAKIAQYLQTHNEANLQDVSSQLEKLKCDYAPEEMRSSIFQIGDGITEEQFVQYISETTGKDSESIKDAAGLLFDILDTNENSSKLLTTDELDFISDDGQTIDGFELWNSALLSDTNEVIKDIEILKSENEAQNAEEFGAATGETEEAAEKYTDLASEGTEEAAEEYTDISSEETEEVSESENTEGIIGVEETEDTSYIPETSSFLTGANLDMTNPQSVRSFLDSFIDSENIKTYNEAIDFLSDTLGWSQDEIEQIRQTLSMDGLSEQNKEQINKLTEQGLTYDEALNALRNKGLIKEDNSALNNEITEENKAENNAVSSNQLSDKQINVFTDELKNGFGMISTDKEQINSILDNKNISPDNFAKIIDNYNEKYGSIVKALENSFPFKADKTEIMNLLADKLLDSAKNGNESAIKVLCKEIYNSTAGMVGTADEFIARIMDTADEKVLGKIVNNYADYNNGASIFKNIKSDFSFGTEDKYIDKLTNAFAKYSEEE